MAFDKSHGTFGVSVVIVIDWGIQELVMKTERYGRYAL